MVEFGFNNMPIDIQLWAINQGKQAKIYSIQIKKDRIKDLIISYIKLKQLNKNLNLAKRISNCLKPIKLEKE
jgi:hypothetical protein